MSALLPVDDRFQRLAAALSDPQERHAMETMLPGYLRTQRWFGGQARGLTHATFVDWLDLGLDVDASACMVDASDLDGLTTRHQLYLGISERDGVPAVADALEQPEVREFLGDLALRGLRVEGASLALTGHRTEGQDTSTAGMESHVLGMEQSNTSIAFGGSYILKVYRKLEAGPNPDIELLSALGSAGFSSAPALLGSATLVAADGFEAAAMMIQAFVPNEGDGWEWGVECARRAIEACESAADIERWLNEEESSLEGARTLGRTTAEMHAALAAATGIGLAPAPLSASEVDDLQAEIREEAAATAELATRAMLGADIIGAISEVATSEGRRLDECGLRIRVHGDYHLGQVLRSAGGFVVTDFEGEPARPLSERRQGQSALVDVAGMVRSFDYAGQAALRALPAARERAELAAAWSGVMASAFLDAYWQTATTARVEFLPARETREQLLRLFGLRKALYELRYELNNRPDWADIPAASIVRMGALPG